MTLSRSHGSDFNLKTTYTGFRKGLAVRMGWPVAAGQFLGYGCGGGADARTPDAVIFFQVLDGWRPLDPVTFLAERGVQVPVAELELHEPAGGEALTVR